MKLLETPDDVKLKILEVSDPQDIRTCQQVCRNLYDLIVSSPQIQYILALDALGYTLPSVPRLDLTLQQKIELLERHRRNWSFPGNCQPVEYVIQLSEAGIPCQYDGGVYTHPLFSAPYEHVVGLHFYRLPSPNAGLELREWRIPDLGLLAQEFAIDAAQDLLVLVELNGPTSTWSEGCLIHLRTMSDNSQHPKATMACLVAEFTESEGDLGFEGTLPGVDFQIDVVDNVLAILFISSHMTSWVIVWDWNRGVEVTRISTGARWKQSSFTLLSPNRLLLPRCSKSFHTREEVPGDTLGSLDIYVYDPRSSTSTPPRMVASFELPKLERRSCQSELRIEGHQRPKANADPRPKVFDLAAQDQLIAVKVQLRFLPAAFEGVLFQSGLIYVPTNVLLHPRAYTQSPDKVDGVTLDHEHVTKVPWGDWAHLTSWDEYDALNLRTSVYGQRAAEFPTCVQNNEGQQAEITREMFLLDFNPKRVRRARLGKDNETKEPGTISEAATPTRWRDEPRGRFGAIEFCEPRAECVKRVLRAPSGPPSTTVHRVIMDEEHVILQKLELPHEFHITGKLSLHVYTL